MVVREKLWTLVLLVIVILAVFLLSSSIAQLEMSYRPLLDTRVLGQLLGALRQLADVINGLVIVFLVVLVAVFLIAKPSRSRPRVESATRRSFLGTLLRILFLVIALLVIHRQIQSYQINLNPTPIDSLQIPSSLDVTLPALNDIPEWLSILFGFAIFLALGWLFWMVLRGRPSSKPALKSISQNARTALDHLESGEQLRNVILRCYAEMEKTLHDGRGIKRKEGMTPREFIFRLDQIGLPEKPIAQLTALFEVVRYGDKQLDQTYEEQAIACLKEIIWAIDGQT